MRWKARAPSVLIAFILVISAAAPGLAQEARGPAVSITVLDVRPAQGFVVAALHDERGWSSPPAAVARAAVSTERVVVTLRAPRPGRYGVRLFLDANANGQFDMNLVGLPLERYGFSNDAAASFGPPSFEAAAFEIDDHGAGQTITLR